MRKPMNDRNKKHKSKVKGLVGGFLLSLLVLTVLTVILVNKDAFFSNGTPTQKIISIESNAEAPGGTLTGPSISSPAPVTPEPAASPSPDTSGSPTATPAPSPEEKLLSGLVIGVDPGHQAHGNSEQEPVSPVSSDTKNKVSSGTQGAYSRVPEHEVNLAVGLLLRDMLEQEGATVIMTRTASDVDVSNVERALLFNENDVDLGIRLHCNGSTDSSVHGAFMLVPKDAEYPYYEECVVAAQHILDAYGRETGVSTKKGITYRSDQTGFNWCERPVVNIEMGHMTNKEEDLKLTDPEFQTKMARGIYNGIVEYFLQKDRKE
jgi:N-acetylmuramoyl-L-alanine amidase